PVVRQSPQTRALGVLAVLASALGGEDDRAVLAQGHGADGLVTAGDAAGPLTADVGEVRQIGVPLGVEEGVRGDDATALIRQETLQAAGVEESGHSVVGRHSSILALSREPGTVPVGKLPGAASERGRRSFGGVILPAVPDVYRKFGAGAVWPSIVTGVSIFSSSSAAFACDFRARISMERLTRRPLILYPVCTPYMRVGSLLMARISVGTSSPWKLQYSPASSDPVLS